MLKIADAISPIQIVDSSERLKISMKVLHRWKVYIILLCYSVAENTCSYCCFQICEITRNFPKIQIYCSSSWSSILVPIESAYATSCWS